MNKKKKVIFIYEGVKAEEKLLGNMVEVLCIINSVPLFLLEYYGEDFWNRVTGNFS